MLESSGNGGRTWEYSNRSFIFPAHPTRLKDGKMALKEGDEGWATGCSTGFVSLHVVPKRFRDFWVPPPYPESWGSDLQEAIL